MIFPVIKRSLRFLGGTQVEHILAKGSLLAFLIQGSGAALLLLTEIVAARLLGVTQFGIYTMATAWIYILGMLGTLGFNHALLKFVPTYLAHHEWGALRGIVRRSNLWVALASLLFVIIGYLILLILRDAGIRNAVIATFAVALIVLPFQVLSSLRQAVLRSLNKIAYALMPEFILRPLLFMLLLAATAYLVPQSLSAMTAFLLVLVAAIAAFAVGAIWQHKYLPCETRSHPPIYRDREWLLTALPLLLIVGLNLISSRIDVIMLGMLSEIEHVGIYSAASRVADVVVFGLVSANAVVAPMIARLHSTGRQEELQRMVYLAAKGICLLTLPIALILLIFGHQILGLFGQGFSAGYPVLVILVCGQLVNALAGPVGYLMTMTGHQVKAARMVGISAMLNLALNGLLIPVWGMIGAAIATAISTVTWNILMLRFVHTELSIRSSVLHFFGKKI